MFGDPKAVYLQLKQNRKRKPFITQCLKWSGIA